MFFIYPCVECSYFEECKSKNFSNVSSDSLSWFSVDYKKNLLDLFCYTSLVPHKSFRQPPFQ